MLAHAVLGRSFIYERGGLGGHFLLRGEPGGNGQHALVGPTHDQIVGMRVPGLPPPQQGGDVCRLREVRHLDY